MSVIKANENLNLIYKVINDLRLSYRQDEFYDLGLIGLTKAIQTYDESKGTVGNYGYMCIKNEILTELAREKEVDLLSLDYDMTGEEFTLTDIIPNNVNLERDMLKKEEMNELYYCLLKLKDKEIEVISSYFGLGREKITLNQIAKNMNLSKQRVCVIKQKALNKLWLYIRKERKKVEE